MKHGPRNCPEASSHADHLTVDIVDRVVVFAVFSGQ
jgi:hypothetical protein